MSARDDLAEVAIRAAAAADVVRAAAWRSRAELTDEAARVEGLLREAEELRTRPALFTPVVAGLPGLGRAADDPAIAAEIEAREAVDAARLAVAQAFLLVLRARISVMDTEARDAEGDSGKVRSARWPTAVAARASTADRHVRTVATAAREELAHIVADRPRDIAFRLSISLGFGLAYLAFLRFILWRSAEGEFPFLALYAFSGMAGSAVCTNALCVDAAAVREKLLRGDSLWRILVAKNLVLFTFVGALGTALNLVLFAHTRDSVTLLKATGLLCTMLLLWFGVGNVLSVASPLRAEPLSVRRRTGTLRRFLIAFVLSYGISYLVNLMLYWRIWAKQTLLERLGSPWIPVLLVVASAAATYVMLTVLAIALAERPQFRRGLTLEMVPYQPKSEPSGAPSAPVKPHP